MSDEKKIRKAVEESDAWLIKRQRAHIKNVEKSITALQKKILNQMTQLGTTKDGELLGLRTNLKQSQKIHTKIARLYRSEFTSEMKAQVAEMEDTLKVVQKGYKTVGESVRFTSVDRDAMRVLRDGMYRDYIAISDQSQAKVIQAMYDNVLGGGEMATLITQIESALLGTDVALQSGRSLASLARMFARDMTMNYHNEVNVYKGEQIGMKDFLYVGDIMGTTRDFCRRRVGRVYTKKQINGWTYKWAGKSGPAMTHRGGYNCRHHWQPVRKEWMGEKKRLDVADWNLEQISKG